MMPFWIVGQREGKIYRAGPYFDRGKAQSLGINWSGSAFEIYELKTTDPASAGRALKHIVAEKSGNICDGLQRQRVNRSGEQKARKEE
jgi:hypothetical protein